MGDEELPEGLLYRSRASNESGITCYDLLQAASSM